MKALAPLEVVWNHVPGHEGIQRNEAADQLARATTKKDEPVVMTPLEDGTVQKNSIDEPKETTEKMINISPNCTSSEDSDSPDEEKSITEHQSHFWDQEGLDQSNSNECPRCEHRRSSARVSK